GGNKTMEVMLNSMDWVTPGKMPAWNQNMVQKENGASGFWPLFVAEAGVYSVQARHFPPEVAMPIAKKSKFIRAELHVAGMTYKMNFGNKAQQVMFSN